MVAPAGFNSRKAAQVIAYFACKNSTRRLNVLKAAKLVYLADRESLSRFGFPILDDERVSMPHGPVNSITYSFISGEYEDAGWSEFLRDRSNHELSVRHEARTDNWDELSDAEIACLDEVWRKFGGMTQWEIRDWTHDKKNVPEWEDPKGSSRPIPIDRILNMLRVDNAAELAAQIDDFKSIDSLFLSVRASS